MLFPSAIALAIVLPLASVGAVNETPAPDTNERVAVTAETATDTPSKVRSPRYVRSDSPLIVAPRPLDESDQEQAIRPPVRSDSPLIVAPRPLAEFDEEQGFTFRLQRSRPVQERTPDLAGAFEEDSSES